MGNETGTKASTLTVVDGFSVAESVAEEIIEAILEEGGQELYKVYLKGKSFAYASEVISTILQSELALCFVRHDRGECEPLTSAGELSPSSSNLGEGWCLESEPPRCRIDTGQGPVSQLARGCQCQKL